MNETSNRLCKLLSDFQNSFQSGGFLHVVIDDGNWETEYIVWSLMHYKDYCTEKELEYLDKHEEEIIEMCSLILNIPEEQRNEIWEVLKWGRAERG